METLIQNAWQKCKVIVIAAKLSTLLSLVPTLLICLHHPAITRLRIISWQRGVVFDPRYRYVLFAKNSMVKSKKIKNEKRIDSQK
jgi:hypothetical protein